MNLNWLKLKPVRKVQVVNRDEAKLTLSDWRSDQALVAKAMRLFADPDFRLMLAVLRNEHPGSNVLPDDAQPHRSIAIQRRAEGYTMALSNIEAMARYSEIPQPLEATFEEEDLTEINVNRA